MTENSNKADKSNPQKKSKISFFLVDVRNLAIISACVAVTFAALNTMKQNASAKETRSTIEKIEAPTNVELVPMSVQDGVLVMGTDKSSEQFKSYMDNRIKSVDDAGPVVSASTSYTSGHDQEKKQYKPEQITSTPKRPEIDTSEMVIVDAHPAPFIDETARASIDTRAQLAIEAGNPGVVKIGYHLDGGPMSTREKEEQIRHTLSNIPDDWTITYKSPSEKLRLYVFTDPTCPYCKNFHVNMQELLDAGISVHYLLYPRDQANAGGSLSKTALNMRNIWCSANQKQALNDAFDGYRIPESDCSTLPAELNRKPAPVPDHFYAGEMFDIQYTPTYFASNGKSGYGFIDVNGVISKITP